MDHLGEEETRKEYQPQTKTNHRAYRETNRHYDYREPLNGRNKDSFAATVTECADDTHRNTLIDLTNKARLAEGTGVTFSRENGYVLITPHPRQM